MISSNEQSYAVVRQPWFDSTLFPLSRITYLLHAFRFDFQFVLVFCWAFAHNIARLTYEYLSSACCSLAPKYGIEKCSRTLCGCLLPAGLHPHKCQGATTLVRISSLSYDFTHLSILGAFLFDATFISTPLEYEPRCLPREQFSIFFVLFFSFLVLFHFSHAHKQRNSIKNYRLCTVLHSVSQS